MFKKYQHIENMKSNEIDGILLGTVHVFYKIDGTNASIWRKEKNLMGYGSRNRELTLDSDNAGFMAWAIQQENIRNFFTENPTLRLFGEWLVPHSLKTYRADAWRNFYVFDVMDGERYLPYEEYKPLLEEFGIQYIPPLAIYKNPSAENLHDLIGKCGQYLVEDGKGNGEGIVIKNYDFVNKYGRVAWAKIITNEFKEVHHKEMGAPIMNGTQLIEETIVDEFCTDEFIGKEQAKIAAAEGGEWSNKLIPKLMGVVYYEFIREFSWEFIKKHKNPTVNYALINKLVVIKCRRFLGF